jgi:hypothetical protein
MRFAGAGAKQSYEAFTDPNLTPAERWTGGLLGALMAAGPLSEELRSFVQTRASGPRAAGPDRVGESSHSQALREKGPATKPPTLVRPDERATLTVERRAGGKPPKVVGDGEGPERVVHGIEGGRVLLGENHMDLIRLGASKSAQGRSFDAYYLQRGEYKAFMDRLYTNINSKNTLSLERKAQALELYRALKQARAQSGNAGPSIEPVGPHTSSAEMDINRRHEGAHSSLENLGGKSYEHWQNTNRIEVESAFGAFRDPLTLLMGYSGRYPEVLAEEAFAQLRSGEWRQFNIQESEARAALKLLMREGHSYGPKIYRTLNADVDPVARKWAGEIMQQWQQEWLTQRGDPSPPRLR